MTQTNLFLSRRQALQALALLVGAPLVSAPIGVSLAATGQNSNRKLLATQLLNGITPATLSVIEQLFTALTEELGQQTVNQLITAVLERDAASITQPFDSAPIEQAAQRLLEMFYSGEIKNAEGQADALYFHQALTWQVLDFTKPPSICGPGFGWWTAKPVIA